MTLARFIYHMLLWPRFRHNRAMRKFAKTVPEGSRVLEFGSGKQVRGGYPFSAAKYFSHCDFVQSDVVSHFGHQIIDITDPGVVEVFDVVLASSVLEHVYDFQAAIDGIWRALRPGGIARIRVPFLFPLHDEPLDFWRFTEHSLARMLGRFRDVSLRSDGLRRVPFGYVAIATK
jgi:SAM-dependent methyltransferase